METQDTTLKVFVSLGGAQPPDWFVAELVEAMGFLLAMTKKRYETETGQTLQVLRPSPEEIERILGDKAPGTLGFEAINDASDMEEVTPAEFEDHVKQLMALTGIDRDRAVAICESSAIPEDVKELLITAMVERGNLTREAAADFLENGPKFDAYGATRGCQCDGCKARRAAYQERIQAQRAARFN